MTTQIKTAKGTFEIHKCSWGWGVLNLVTGHVDQRETEQECLELLQSHGPAGQDNLFGRPVNDTSCPAIHNDDDIRPAAEGQCVCGDPADTILDDIDFPICRACAGFITGKDDHLYPTLDKIVCYYRVSIKKQERSGLGLEDQQAAIAEFARRNNPQVLAAYTETETGKRADRPELAKALAHAKRARATLVVAKLDRFARNVAFTSALMEAGVEFIACDNPHANRLTIHILTAVAEDEARRISERTKAALAAYKVRGGKLGAARPEC